MRVGIIAEGRGDHAVITNLLKGVLDLDQADITYIRPELSLDETDLHTLTPNQHGTWLFVKEECQNAQQVEAFLGVFDEPRLLVIHLDTAETYRPEYGVTAPDKGDLKVYSETLREQVIALIDGWLQQRHREHLRYAIAIEETDAWVLTLYSDPDKDTCAYRTPKERLKTVLNQKRKDMKKVSQLKTFPYYLEISSDFRKLKRLRQHMTKNHSLRLFCESLLEERDPP